MSESSKYEPLFRGRCFEELAAPGLRGSFTKEVGSWVYEGQSIGAVTSSDLIIKPIEANGTGVLVWTGSFSAARKPDDYLYLIWKDAVWADDSEYVRHELTNREGVHKPIAVGTLFDGADGFEVLETYQEPFSFVKAGDKIVKLKTSKGNNLDIYNWHDGLFTHLMLAAGKTFSVDEDFGFQIFGWRPQSVPSTKVSKDGFIPPTPTLPTEQKPEPVTPRPKPEKASPIAAPGVIDTSGIFDEDFD